MHKANCQVAAAVTATAAAASWGALQKAFASHSAAKTQTQHASFVIRVQFHRYTGRCLAPAAIHAHLRAFTLSNVYRSQVSSIVQLFAAHLKRGNCAMMNRAQCRARNSMNMIICYECACAGTRARTRSPPSLVREQSAPPKCDKLLLTVAVGAE